jgi:effector-binding domain-containing protein
MVAPTHIVNEPVIAESPRRFVIYQHHVVDEPEMALTIGRSYQALYARVADAGVIPIGPPFVMYHLEQSDPGVRWDMDVCVPISAPISASPQFDYMELAATRVVSLLHIGPYDTLGKAYDAIESYIADKELDVSGPPREFYLSPPDVPPDEIQTLVERPII